MKSAKDTAHKIHVHVYSVSALWYVCTYMYTCTVHVHVHPYVCVRLHLWCTFTVDKEISLLTYVNWEILACNLHTCSVFMTNKKPQIDNIL